ncbi:MAG: class I SAM-dependent methyltransferase [Balneolaceae bacterium]
MNKLYNAGYHNSEDGAPEKGWAYDTEFLKPAFQQMEDRKAKILDFGCGESKLPAALRDQGHQVTGVDIAPPLQKQENRLTGDILELCISENQFDLIYSYQVFEHIPDPLPILTELFRITKKGGFLLVHTDMEVPERFENGFRNWWYISPPDHCVFYRNRTFEVYLQDKPHELVYKDEKSVIMKK